MSSPFIYLSEMFSWRIIALIGLSLLLVLMGLGLTETAWVTRAISKQTVTSTAYPPELQAAWEAEDWAKAITVLTPLRQTQPNSRLVQGWLAQAYLQNGLKLRYQGRITEAQLNLTQTLALVPDNAVAQRESRLARAYLAGTAFYQQGRWLETVRQLTPIWREESHYGHVSDLLYNAYYNQGLAEHRAAQRLPTNTLLTHVTPTSLWRLKKLHEAHRMFELALALRPGVVAPRDRLTQIEAELSANKPIQITAEVTHKLIVVGLAEQRMWVYDHDKLIFDFVVSTGENGQETAVGDFSILNKIDVAYASTWNLDMPYWMGIYWAGSLQNGIHSLPIVRDTGYKLWDGFLGQRVSYGCVILSDEDAATLYNWAEVGTKIKIVYSLSEWANTDITHDQ